MSPQGTHGGRGERDGQATRSVPAQGPLSPQISQLNALITLLIGNLSAGDRTKVMTICTIDVHARDVVAKMITAKAREPGKGRGRVGIWCSGAPR